MANSDNLTIEETSAEEPMADGTSSTANVVIEMEAMIKNHLSSIDRLQEELVRSKDMLDDIFNNDETFRLHTEKAKEAAKIKSQTKMQILKQPQAAELNEKVKNTKAEVKELQEALSDYLREYQRMSGISEIEGDDGELREIVYVAKLVKKSSKY